MKVILVVIFLSKAFSAVSQEPSAYYRFRLRDKQLDKSFFWITNADSSYKIRSYSSANVLDTTLIHYLTFQQEKGEIGTWSAVQNYDLFYTPFWIEVIKQQDTMNIVLKKYNEYYPYALSKKREPIFDTITFRKGNFLVDGRRGKPSFKDWLQPDKSSIVSPIPKKFTALIKKLFPRFNESEN